MHMDCHVQKKRLSERTTKRRIERPPIAKKLKSFLWSSFKMQLGDARKLIEENKRSVLSRAFGLVDDRKRGFIDW